MRRRRATRIASTLLVFGLAACGDDPVTPTLELVAGTYEATSFTAEGQDILAAGGSLTLTLDTDGTVSGNLFVPESVGGPIDADMAGTFVLTGSSITIEQAADTFVRDTDWTWSNGALQGTFTGSSGTVSVVLERV